MPGPLFTLQAVYKRWTRFAAILWTLLIFVLCLWPGRGLPKSQIPLIDKWVHFVLFAPFTFLWACVVGSVRGKVLIAVFAAGCATGFIVELLQAAFPALGRSYDLLDIIADGIGCLLGMLLFAGAIVAFHRMRST
jgi:VanZ family protein